MKTFILFADISISIHTKVEAETLEDAIKIAEDRDLMQIPHGIGEDSKFEWIADELDGQPKNIREEY